ncbi:MULTISPECIES: hypothetical protein [Arthrobacter]|jgi:hypothetical protein|uniref:Uncharacterized protein n=1 Tax=Arthrobacter bambusae TaxID=1338426 RepID=A0AAW8DES5_9MICC|nr:MULTISPECIES: hypothetical protein [Arthrobacter]MDP9903916.1 hypothetical protein [Arthrobacter bambusae]MDQ0128088.1 hypothetical protein [Arthrobacter bambusae]MDQ0179430.1 hypothetical protein [Arthrobacter bambusae]GAP60259.1 hypothetical protein AHiyo1_37470 [Arthrobacter sp. Hiyo1]
MFRGSFVVGALVLLFGAAAVLGFGAIFRAKSVAARIDAAAAGILAAAMAAVGLGWAPLGVVPLGAATGVVFLLSVVRIVYQGPRAAGAAGAGRWSAIYGAAVAALSGWVLLSASSGAGSVSDHPGHQLGIILADIMGAILMLFAATGWLLGTFAMPAESKSHAVPRLKGVREALVAAGLAVALYAIS